MFKYKCKLLKFCIFIISLLLLCYYIIVNNYTYNKHEYNSEKVPTSIKVLKENNIWLIFTKVTDRSPLKYKFRSLLLNLLNISSVPLKFNIIIDLHSKEIAEKEISDIILNTNKFLYYTFYDVEECASKIQDIVDVLTPHFSSKPGTYYSDALFYISLGLHKIAPKNQDKAVLLDCDIKFKKDVNLIFKEFNSFKPTALFGLAPELTPVYRHILHIYKRKVNTTFGEYYHDNPISKTTHPRGFQGYNSGVVLINLKELRNSEEFKRVTLNETVYEMTGKYKFRGHLGDQDFYTLLGMEYPDLIQTIHCGYNRQLCTWWRDRGYQDIFDFYFQCKHPTVILHGNCNTPFPS